jgi:hypothetical protein
MYYITLTDSSAMSTKQRLFYHENNVKTLLDIHAEIVI